MNGVVERERDGLIAAAGAIVVLAAALLLSPLRDRIGLTNVALILTLVVVVAAVFGGRIAGTTTALVAALGFNAVHTRPYGSLRIDRPEDILTCVLMIVVGVVVGQLAHWAGVRNRRGGRGSDGVRHLDELAALVAGRASRQEVVERASVALVEQLRLESCRFVAGVDSGASSLVELGSRGELARGDLRHHPDGFELPRSGVSLPVRAPDGSTVGRFVMRPTPGTGVSLLDRQIAGLVADLVAPALQRLEHS